MNQVMGRQWNSWFRFCDKPILAIVDFFSSRKEDIKAQGCIHPPLQKAYFSEKGQYGEEKNQHIYGKFGLSSQTLYLAQDLCRIWQFMNTIHEVYLWQIPPSVHLLISLIHRHFYIFLFLLPSFRLYCFHYTFFQIPWLMCKAVFKDKLTIPKIYDECMFL